MGVTEHNYTKKSSMNSPYPTREQEYRPAEWDFEPGTEFGDPAAQQKYSRRTRCRPLSYNVWPP